MNPSATVATTHEERAGTEAKLQFYDLSHPWGHNAPLWPYFPDVKIERFHYMAKSGVLSQQITTFMHCTTHTDAPAHVVEGTRFIDRGAAQLLLRDRSRGLDPQGEVGGDHRRGPRECAARDTAGRHRDRQYRLAPLLRRQPDVLHLLARHLQGGGRVASRSRRQGLRDRLPGARPSARNGDRPAARTDR